MKYNIQFQTAGFFVVLILVIIFFSKKRLKTLQNKIFSVLMIDALIQLAFDIISVCTIVNRDTISPAVNMFFSKGYLIFMTSFVYLIDIYALSNTLYEGIGEKHLKIKKITAGLITAFFLATVIYIFPAELLFAGEGFSIYSYGAASDAVFRFSGVSVGIVILMMLINCRRIPLRRQLSIYSFCVMEGSVALVQMLNRELLIVGFGSAVIVLIMYFALENPDMNMIAELERSKQEAMEANQAKSSFLARMSHEIRTPINAVLGMNEMILRESKEEAVIEYATNAYNAGKALLSVINDILDISKIEAGKLEIVESEYDLYSLISDCYHMTTERAEKKGLEFICSPDETLPSKLLGDMFHIRQIIVNFLTNAIKYTDTGSVELSFSGENTGSGFMLKIRVKDTGIGLTEESMEKLFSNFQRFDLKRNQTVEGTGLGLSICKQLAELMGGNVYAESVYGEGSSFYCTVPQQIVDSSPIGKLDLKRPADRVNVEVKKFTAPAAKILVVDDVEMNLFVFKSFLKETMIKIDTASSGKECIKLAESHKYDIIFMDHMMPEMDGIETFNKLRYLKLLDKGTPVIMLTANALLGDEEKYLEKGFSAYLSKPVQSDKLGNMLLEFLPKNKIIFSDDTAAQNSNEPSDTDVPAEGSELFDIKTGLNYNGSRETYFGVLKMYVQNSAEKIERIRSLAESGEWKNYITEVHALKSSSLMIGSKKLSEAAKELELAGKAGKLELIKEKNDSLLELYGEVASIGKELLLKEGMLSDNTSEEEHSDAELTEISEEKLKELIKQTAEACEGFDGETAGMLCDEAAGYSYGGKALRPFFNEIKAAMDDFEYDAAAEAASALLDKLK